MSARSIAIAFVIALVLVVIDFYALHYVEKWLISAINGVGLFRSLLYIFLPKFIYGVLAGLSVRSLEKKFLVRSLQVLVLIFFGIYYIWKFFASEVWIANNLLAYAMAIGPYLGFFIGYAIGVKTNSVSRITS